MVDPDKTVIPSAQTITSEREAQTAQLSAMIRDILSPVMETIGQILRQNTEAVERIAAAQQMQAERMEALEKQMRLQTPVTPSQVRHLNDAIRTRARDLLSKRDSGVEGLDLCDDARAVKALSALIRKAVLAHWGAAALHEIPRHEYSTAGYAIGSWNDALAVRDVVKEARERAKATGQPADMDGAQALSGPDGEPGFADVPAKEE